MIRTIFKSDLEELLAIEKSVHTIPWNEDTFKMCFQPGYIGWAMEHNNRLIGFIIVSLHIEECHILNVCVLHDYQRKGWGQKLLEYALEHARTRGIGIAYLEVRRSNSRAIALYKKLKFHLIGERKDYYPTLSGHEDALIFARSLHEDAI